MLIMIVITRLRNCCHLARVHHCFASRGCDYDDHDDVVQIIIMMTTVTMIMIMMTMKMWWWSWPWLPPSQSAPLFRKRGVADEDESLHCQSCFYLNLSLILFTSIFQIFDQKKAEGDTKRWLTRDCHTVTVIFTSFNYIRDFFPSGGGGYPIGLLFTCFA